MPFEMMVDDLYASDIAIDVVFRPGGLGDGIGVRAITKAPDAVVDVSDTQIVTGTRTFRVRAMSVPAPIPGDTVTLESGEAFAVQGEPRRIGRLGLEWLLDVVPA